MKNPIINNRIVKGITFATRLLSFAKDINVSDACSEDEKDSMISYAETLLRYQIFTVTDTQEIEYLKRVRVYEKYKTKSYITYDGVKIYDFENTKVFSILKEYVPGDAVITRTINNIEKDILSKRVYFISESLCTEKLFKNITDYKTTTTSEGRCVGCTSEFSICDICKKPNFVKRVYYTYKNINCLCCGTDHKEFTTVCPSCIPKPPDSINITKNPEV